MAHAQRNVADQLGFEAVAIWRAVTLVPSRPAIGEVLMPSVIDIEGSSTMITGSGRGSSGIGERLADRDLGDPGHGDDLPRPCLCRLDAIERLGHIQLGDLRALDRAVGAAPGDLLAASMRPLRTRQIARRPT